MATKDELLGMAKDPAALRKAAKARWSSVTSADRQERVSESSSRLPTKAALS